MMRNDSDGGSPVMMMTMEGWGGHDVNDGDDERVGR